MILKTNKGRASVSKRLFISLFCLTMFCTLAFGQSLKIVDDPEAQRLLLEALKNARSSKQVRLVSSGVINNKLREDSIFEFIGPDRLYQKVTKSKSEGTFTSEKIKIGRQTFEYTNEKWVLERNPIVDIKDNYLSTLAPILVSSEAKSPKMNYLKVERIGTETIGDTTVVVYVYELDSNWLCFQGKFWISEKLPIKSEMWTPDGSLNRITSSTTYSYDSKIAIETPNQRTPRKLTAKP